MISREDSLKLVKKHVKNINLVYHMIAVSSIMGKMAEKHDEDKQLWEAVGMLHDVDGLVSAEMVKDILPEEGLHAIRAHNEMTGFKAENKLDISLFAADALSGMIISGALVRPTKLEGMKPKSIKKRMKDKSFARAISRENIQRCEETGIPLNEFIRLGIEAMQEVSKEIGFS